jgi:O-antigen ligase
MGFIPIVFGPYRVTAAHEMSRMLKVGLLFVVVTNELERPKRIVQCAMGLCLAMIGQSTIGMVQYVTKKHLGLTILGEANPGTLDQLAEQTLSGVRAFRVSALMSHPNIFSIFLAVAILIAIACFLLRGRMAPKLVFVISALLGMAALIATLSRSGWLSFAAACAVFMALMTLHPRLQGRALLLGGCAGAGLFVVCLAFAGPVITRLYESKDGAMLSRAEYNRTARAMIAVHPVLGWGLNSYVWVAPPFTKWGAKGARERFKGWLPPVHNIYLLWTAETGYVGFALHLALWIWVAATAVRNLDVANETLFAINVACLSGLVVFAFDGFFSFTWRINSIMRLYWLIAAMILAIRYQKESKRPV